MAGDALVLHYSGHGVQRKDKDGDEINGFDDAIVPLDYKKNGLILDDEINKIIVGPIPTGVRLHAIMDCCKGTRPRKSSTARHPAHRRSSFPLSFSSKLPGLGCSTPAGGFPVVCLQPIA